MQVCIAVWRSCSDFWRIIWFLVNRSALTKALFIFIRGFVIVFHIRCISSICTFKKSPGQPGPLSYSLIYGNFFWKPPLFFLVYYSFLAMKGTQCAACVSRTLFYFESLSVSLRWDFASWLYSKRCLTNCFYVRLFPNSESGYRNQYCDQTIGETPQGQYMFLFFKQSRQALDPNIPCI